MERIYKVILYNVIYPVFINQWIAKVTFFYLEWDLKEWTFKMLKCQ